MSTVDEAGGGAATEPATAGAVADADGTADGRGGEGVGGESTVTQL